MRNTTRSLPAEVRTAAGFLDQESGSVTIFAIVGFAMCMVIVGLVFDLGRVMGIHTEVSSYADRVALAAAKELDGKPGALRDAINAARAGTSVIGEGNRFSLNGDDTDPELDGKIGVRQLTFLSSLDPVPPGPDTVSPMPGDVVTATWRPGQVTPSIRGGLSAAQADARTRFVIVDTNREREEFILFPIMAAMTPTLGDGITISPQAVAGFDRRMCNITPVMVCNTSEPQASFNPPVGTQTRFKLQGRGNNGVTNNWATDTYSLLNVDSTSPANLRNYIRRDDPNTQCYGRQSTIERNLNSADAPPGRLDTKTEIGRGFNDRWDSGDARDRDFTAAVVDCVANRNRLNNGQSVPIDGFVIMRMRQRIDLNDQNRDDEILLENRGFLPRPDLDDENAREYAVLVR
jgi:hypothetical protein